MKTESPGHLTWYVDACSLFEPSLRSPLTGMAPFDTSLPICSNNRRHDGRTGSSNDLEPFFGPEEKSELLCEPVVLVPIDFSAVSRCAVQVGVSVALHTHAKLILCHAIFPKVIPFGPAAQPWVGEAFRSEAMQKMGPLAGIARAAGLRPTCIVEEGTPAGVILNLAARYGVDLIVLAPRQHSLWARLLFGPETSEQVIREAECGVMVIRGAP